MKLLKILPFMESQEIKDLAIQIINGESKGIKLVLCYPFLNREDLDEVIELCIEKGQSKDVNLALPFASKETIKKIYEGIKSGSLKGISEHMLFPFLSKEQRKSVFDDLVKEAANDPSQEEDDEIYVDDEEELKEV